MKILYVLNSNVFGGMEKHVEDLVRGMISHNHDVYVWCLSGGAISEIYKDLGASVYTDTSISSFIDPKYISKLTQFLKENDIDILHAHELKAVANALIAGYLAKTPVRISHTHTPISEWQSNNFLKKLSWIPTSIGYSFEVNLLSHMEIALTQSRKKVKMLEGMLSNKLEVIPNSLPIKQFDIAKSSKTKYRKEILKRYKLSEDAFIFGNIGRITQEKGTEVLVRAFAEFLKHPLKSDHPFYLMLVGGGKLEPEIKKLINELGIKKNVILTGVFEEADKAKYYSALDVFVFPTLAEGFGLVLMEAMISRVPTLSSDLPVLREVAEDTIKYFEVGDYLDLAQKMDLIYKETLDGEYNVDKGRELVLERYSMDNFVKSYINLYMRLLAK